MIAITVAYPAGNKMNTDYYYGSHVQMVENTLTEYGLKASEVRKIVGTPTGDPAPYQIITTLYFESMQAYSSAMASDAGRHVLSDIKNFFEGMPDIMIGEV